MGCDIHATIEVKKFKDESWWGYAKGINIDRSYYLFGMLAGVRGDSEPIVQQRGFPENASYDAREEKEKWDADAHSPSWLTFKEIKDASESKKYTLNGTWSVVEEEFYKVMKLAAKKYGEEGVRLVFFFDN